MKEGSTDIHRCSINSVKYVYVNLYFYNMLIHLNLYSSILLELVNPGYNIMHEICAKMGLVSFINFRLFVVHPLVLPSQLKRQGKGNLFLLVQGWIQLFELFNNHQEHSSH